MVRHIFLKHRILGIPGLVAGVVALSAAGVEAAQPKVVEPPEAPARVLQRVCALKEADPAAFRAAFDGARLLEFRADGPSGRAVRLHVRLLMPTGGEWVINRLQPGGTLRRLSLEWHAPALGAPALLRPKVAVNAGGDCRPTEARRLVYGPDGQAETLKILGPDLSTLVAAEPLNPPVPEGAPGPDGAVRVALVDTGVNYTLPLFEGRLARDTDGRLVGYDFWDMDDRPFDVDTARSPFFPLHHGTAVASIILREAPGARILPYRYPRPDMGRFADLLDHADKAGAVIVNMAMGSNSREDWEAFAKAAKARPHMLFIVSAGNDGRDLDKAPVFPAALGLDNVFSVTSADDRGRLARGSNWGGQVVDVMVPGEQVAVIDHRGAEGKASGSSFAVPRVAALAARWLAKHPDWRAKELKAALIKRARTPLSGGGQLLKHGWIPDPLDDFEG